MAETIQFVSQAAIREVIGFKKCVNSDQKILECPLNEKKGVSIQIFGRAEWPILEIVSI